MGKLEGKVAFITGAARGQGRSHAIRLAEEGADIIATRADVRDARALKKAVDDGVAEFGKLDIVVANAGICIVQPWDKAPYVAAKHGVVGIAKSMANELAKHSIRVNTVHPTGVNTVMGTSMGGVEALIGSDPNLGPIFMNTLPVEITEPRDISNAVLFLASDESRYVTGLEFTVDAGNTIR
jgi:NAD(P)-dependent dehydrogenase (short-subunit alcohol dehydrogenase family)